MKYVNDEQHKSHFSFNWYLKIWYRALAWKPMKSCSVFSIVRKKGWNSVWNNNSNFCIRCIYKTKFHNNQYFSNNSASSKEKSMKISDYPRFGPNSSLPISAQLDHISFRSMLISAHSHFGPFPFDYVLLIRTENFEVFVLLYE
jgi:hypothetical protein